MIFCFELPNVGTLQSFPELTSPFVLEVQERYNVQVMFRTRAKLHSTLVMVKGCDWEVIQVKAATIHLINHMCGAFAVSISCQKMVHFSIWSFECIWSAKGQQLPVWWVFQQIGQLVKSYIVIVLSCSLRIFSF